MTNVSSKAVDTDCSEALFNRLLETLIEKQKTSNVFLPSDRNFKVRNLSECHNVCQYDAKKSNKDNNKIFISGNFSTAINILDSYDNRRITLDLAVTRTDLDIDACLTHLICWDILSTVQSLILFPFHQKFDENDSTSSVSRLARALSNKKLIGLRFEAVVSEALTVLVACKQLPKRQLSEEFMRDFRAGENPGIIPVSMFDQIDALYDRLRSPYFISTVPAGLARIKEHCRKNKTNYKVIRREEEYNIQLPLPSVPKLDLPGHVVKGKLNEVFMAELQDVLMYSNFMLCIDRKYLTLTGVLYTPAKYMQMPDLEEGRFGIYNQSFYTNSEVEINEPTVLLGRTNHFGHFFVECLDKFFVIDRFPELKDYSVVTDGPIKQPYSDIFKRMGFEFNPKKVIYTETGTWLRFKHLLIPSISTWKPIFPKHIINFLSERIVAKPSKLAPRGIFISRANCTTRKLVNESEVLEKLKPYDIEPVVFEDLTFDDQINLIASVDVVLGVIGSAFFNLIWAKPQIKVGLIVNVNDIVERNNQGGHPDAVLYHAIGQAKNLDIRNILGSPVSGLSFEDYGLNYNEHLLLEDEVINKIIDWVK